jgi:hypothetical protein
MDGPPKEGWEKCRAPDCPKWFDPKTRPGRAKTCSTECSEKYDKAFRKERWGRIGDDQNALYSERRQPIITVLPLGTVVRGKWSRAPNMVPCAFPGCAVEFDSKKGATFCPEHRPQREQVYQQGYRIEHKEALQAYHKERHAKKKKNTPTVMITCGNPDCPNGENGRPKEFKNGPGAPKYCCKACRMAVWTPANREKTNAASNEHYHAKHPNAVHHSKGRRLTPEHCAKISAAVKRTLSQKKEKQTAKG